MKFSAQVFLVVLFIPLFFLGLISTSVRFQFLNTRFWLSTFEKNRVYDSFSKVLKTGVEKKAVEGGGNKENTLFITSLLTPENIKDIIERNLTNLFNYLNGKVNELIVYIPISKIPKGTLPKNIRTISEDAPIEEVLSKFNVNGISPALIKNLANIGRWSWYIWFINILLLASITFGLFNLVESGARFIALGIAFIFSGVLALFITAFGLAVRGSMLTDWVKSTEPIQIILAPFAPYILGQVLQIWGVLGVSLLILGVVLLFFKKK